MRAAKWCACTPEGIWRARQTLALASAHLPLLAAHPLVVSANPPMQGVDERLLLNAAGVYILLGFLALLFAIDRL